MSDNQITEMFKELVITWVDLDDKVREHAAKMKEFKAEKKD